MASAWECAGRFRPGAQAANASEEGDTAPGKGPMKKDWAVSLGAGGVAQGMLPAKFSFNVNATPSCTADFVVFPVNASTGNTRANVVGTFTAEPAAERLRPSP